MYSVILATFLFLVNTSSLDEIKRHTQGITRFKGNFIVSKTAEDKDTQSIEGEFIFAEKGLKLVIFLSKKDTIIYYYMGDSLFWTTNTDTFLNLSVGENGIETNVTSWWDFIHSNFKIQEVEKNDGNYVLTLENQKRNQLPNLIKASLNKEGFPEYITLESQENNKSSDISIDIENVNVIKEGKQTFDLPSNRTIKQW